MTQEEKSLLLKDLCARLPYGIFVKENRYSLDDGPIIYTYDYHPCIDNCKPYLRSLSNMTEEEARTIFELSGHNLKDILQIKITDEYLETEIDDGWCSSERYVIWYDEIVNSIQILDFLISNHFDYRGLIPMGLALEAFEDMYDK